MGKKVLLLVAALCLVIPAVACVGPAELAIGVISFPDGTIGEAYENVTLEATGGTGEYTFSVVSGALPDGLSLSEAGVISGTPTANASYSLLTIQVSDGETTATTELPLYIFRETGTIRIGCVCTKTGDLGPMGMRMFQGAELAVEELNRAGGVLGKRVVLLEENDDTDGATSAARVRKLVEVDGVKVTIGAWFGDSSGATAPYAEANEIPVVSPSCTLAPSLLADQGWSEYGFRVCLHDGLQGEVLAKVVNDGNYSRAAAIVQDTPYGIGLGEAFFDALDAYNITHMDTVFTYDRAKKDYLTELGQIKTWGPDVVLVVSYCDDGIIVFKQASELEMGIENGIAWLGCDGNYGSGMFKDTTAADFMVNSLVAGTRSVGPSPEEYQPYKNFIDAYTAAYGEAPEVYCDTMYDCVKLIAAAIEEAGIYDNEAIRDALTEVGQNYEGATGVLSWDEHGNRVSGTFEIWKVRQTAEGGYEDYRVELFPVGE